MPKSQPATAEERAIALRIKGLAYSEIAQIVHLNVPQIKEAIRLKAEGRAQKGTHTQE